MPDGAATASRSATSRRASSNRRSSSRASSACCRCAGTDPDTLTVAGQTLVAFHDWRFLLGPGFCAGIGHGLLLGYLMYVSGLLPRRLAVLGLVGGTFAFLAATGALIDVYDRQSAPQFLLTFPEMIWEMTFGIYLVAKGFTSSAMRQDADPRHAPAPVAALA